MSYREAKQQLVEMVEQLGRAPAFKVAADFAFDAGVAITTVRRWLRRLADEGRIVEYQSRRYGHGCQFVASNDHWRTIGGGAS